MRERDVEKKLVEGVRGLGGMACKWVCPGRDGVPDRIIFLPGGQVRFVELKTEAGKLSSRQVYMIAKLRSLGCQVQVLYGEADVKRFIETLRMEVALSDPSERR